MDMLYSPKFLKNRALSALKGHWRNMICCYFAYSFTASFLACFVPAAAQITLPESVVGFLSNSRYIPVSVAAHIGTIMFILLSNMIFSVILSPFRVGFMRCLLYTLRRSPKNLLQVFKNPESWPTAMAVSAIKAFLIFSVLLLSFFAITLIPIYPGIVLVLCFLLLISVNIEFAFVDFVLADNPNMSAINVIKLNFRLLKKHRWHYLNMAVSFILWFVACMLTLGVAMFLLKIYFFMTAAVLYCRISENVMRGASI